MKTTQFLKYASILAIAAFTFACGSDSDPAPDTTPKVTSLSVSTGAPGTSVIVTGSNLNGLDSAKLGKSKIIPSNNQGTTFTFVVPESAFTGKLYVYKGGKVDSTQTFTVTEPTGIVGTSTLTCFVNGKEFSSTVEAENDTINGTPVLAIYGVIGNQYVSLFLPTRIILNQPVSASSTNIFAYVPNSSVEEFFIATGLAGTSGSFLPTEIGAGSAYLRGTFNFVGISSTGSTRATITNGRLALRLR